VTLCDAAEDCTHLIVVPDSIVKDSSVNPEIPETTVTGSGVGVGVGTGVTVGANVGVSVGVGSGVLVLTVGLFVGVVSGVGTGFESEFIPCTGHAILVHPRTPFVQKHFGRFLHL
jgi:ABC-type dipeptide/oligopeptide/nickel transport system permease subunit